MEKKPISPRTQRKREQREREFQHMRTTHFHSAAKALCDAILPLLPDLYEGTPAMIDPGVEDVRQVIAQFLYDFAEHVWNAASSDENIGAPTALVIREEVPDLLEWHSASLTNTNTGTLKRA